MSNNDPRWRKLGKNGTWFIATLIVLAVMFRFYFSPVILAAMWGVAFVWGGILIYKLSQIFLSGDNLTVTAERSQGALVQAEDYRNKIKASLTSDLKNPHSAELQQQIDALLEAIDGLVQRIQTLHNDEVIRRDLKDVPTAIKSLEKRLAAEDDPVMQSQLKLTLANRRKQLASLDALQDTIKRAEMQIESTLSQLGTIYSQLLTGQSTSQVADYSRLAADVDEEVHLLQDHLEALKEVKLGGI